MNALQNFVGFIIVLAIAFGFQAYRDLTKSFPKPDLDLHEYWGPGDVKNYRENKSINPFNVSYSGAVISKLIKQLEESEISTDSLENAAFEYGFHSKPLVEILTYWKGNYLAKWNEREAFLNQFPHFSTQIQGLKIHFIHVKPTVKEGTKVFKLILLHGWPGSIREFYELISMLTKPSKDNIAFEVVVPSLPGYGWSEGASKIGLGALKMSVVLRNLMLRIGFNKFYVQGGDWGSVIGSNMATLFPENVLGYHTNFCTVMSPLSSVKTFIASFYPSMFIEETKLIDWIYPFTPKFMFLLQESGYMHIQATKPDTIGVVLQNNPLGLAVYILEKFSTWTNPEYRQMTSGGLQKYFTLDSLLDNVMIYYLTNSITTSVRIYKEDLVDTEEYDLNRVQTFPPTGCAYFRHEIFHQPEFVLREKFVNIIHKSFHDDGGHFAAMQLPKVLHQDFMEFVQKTLTKIDSQR